MASPQIESVLQILTINFPDQHFSLPYLVGRGVVSSVYRVDAGEESYAIKLHIADRSNISDYEAQEYARERRCLEDAATAGLPCPRVLAIGWYEDTAYSIQTFVSGVNGLDSHIVPREIWTELGRLAHLVHTIPVENAEAKWESYRASILASLTEDDVKIALGIYALHQQDDIRRIFHKLGTLPFRYGLNHCDLHPKNTVVAPSGQVFLLDWGAASRDINLVPHTELASLLLGLDVQDEEFQSFVAGYGLSKVELASMLPEVLAVDLISCFWFSENPPTSEFGYELVAHASRLVIEHLPLLIEWASK